MTVKFKTMTHVEEAEWDRLRQRQIKDYYPVLNSLTKIQDQIFKNFDDKELTDSSITTAILSTLCTLKVHYMLMRSSIVL